MAGTIWIGNFGGGSAGGGGGGSSTPVEKEIYFASRSAVNPAGAEPTEAEMSAAVTEKDVIAYYTGSNNANDPVQSVWYVDKNKKAVLLESRLKHTIPNYFLGSASFSPADPQNPTKAEVKQALNSQGVRRAVVYFTGTTNANDTRRYVYWVDENGDVEVLYDINQGKRNVAYYATRADLPATGEKDVLYVIEDTRELLIWNDTDNAYNNTGKVEFYDTRGDFPTTGNATVLYVARNTKELYYWNGNYVLLLRPLVKFYSTRGVFPGTGQGDTLYVARDTVDIYIWDGSKYIRKTYDWQQIKAADITLTNANPPTIEEVRQYVTDNNITDTHLYYTPLFATRSYTYYADSTGAVYQLDSYDVTEFAPAGDVGAADTSNPTDAEIQQWAANNNITASHIFYTGTDDRGDAKLFVWYVDDKGEAVKVWSKDKRGYAKLKLTSDYSLANKTIYISGINNGNFRFGNGGNAIPGDIVYGGKLKQLQNKAVGEKLYITDKVVVSYNGVELRKDAVSNGGTNVVKAVFTKEFRLNKLFTGDEIELRWG